MLPLLLSLTLPVQAAWTSIGDKHDCVFSKQAEGDSLAIRAECTWPVPAETVIATLSDWSSHGQVFDGVAESVIIGTLTNGAGQVRQAHKAPGISDREVVMDVAVVDIPGGKRFTHSKAADQSALSGDKVEVGRDDGSWEVVATDTGCIVRYELRYDPAGSVPGFVVKWFQGAGFKDMLQQLRSHVGG